MAEKLGTGLQNLVDGSVTRTRLHVGMYCNLCEILQASGKIFTEVFVIPPFALQTAKAWFAQTQRINQMTDKDYLLLAEEVAKKSSEPMPCGCIIVQDGKIVASEFNSQHTDKVAVYHAEIKAITEANRTVGSRTIMNAIAYCTCEPCAMCLTALSYAKVERIVFNKLMADLCPDDPQAHFDSQAFIHGLNFVPKLEQVLL